MLKHILGNLPVIRILDYLLDHQEKDHTKGEIKGNAMIRHVEMQRDFPGIVECGVVIETRKIGGVSLYALDTENEMTQSLIGFDEALTDYCTDKMLDEEVKKIEEPIDEAVMAELPRG